MLLLPIEVLYLNGYQWKEKISDPKFNVIEKKWMSSTDNFDQFWLCNSLLSIQLHVIEKKCSTTHYIQLLEKAQLNTDNYNYIF